MEGGAEERGEGNTVSHSHHDTPATWRCVCVRVRVCVCELLTEIKMRLQTCSLKWSRNDRHKAAIWWVGKRVVKHLGSLTCSGVVERVGPMTHARA
jgi:ribosomal protein L28